MTIKLREERAIENLKEGFIGGKETLVILFILVFLAAFGYWCYELYYIHTHDFNTDPGNDIAILTAAAHEVAAFQACILAFLFLGFLIYIL